MKKIKIFSLIISLIIIAFPIFVYSAPSPDTTNNKTGITYECGDGKTAGNCDFTDLVTATQRVVNIAVKYALFFSVIVIAYAGFRYMKSGDNPGERTKANEMLKKVAIGIAVIMSAWLIVNLITVELLGKNLETILENNQ